MSLLTLAVPKEYGYVLTVTAATFFVGSWHGIYGASHRKGTGVTVPQIMAEKSDYAAAETPEKKKALYLLNCAQRAHANYVENQTSLVGALLISGLEYPVASAALGAAVLFGRVVYTLGYTRKDKEAGRGRELGFFLAMPSQLILQGLAMWTSVRMIL